MRYLPRSGARLTILAALLFGLVFGVGGVQSANLHGIAFSKTCEDPTLVGAPLQCRFGVSNFDTGHNPEVIFSLSDVVQSSGGAIPTGNILPTLELIFNPVSGAGAPTCIGGG